MHTARQGIVLHIFPLDASVVSSGNEMFFHRLRGKSGQTYYQRKLLLDVKVYAERTA
jgi:hypothetical protein